MGSGTTRRGSDESDVVGESESVLHSSSPVVRDVIKLHKLIPF